MSQKYRLVLLSISMIILLIIGRVITGNYSFIYEDFWFTAGLLLLVLLSLIDQPFFPKDSNIFVNAVTAGLSLLLVAKRERDMLFWTFTAFVIYLVISSYVLMWIRKSKLADERPSIQFISRLNRQLGKPEVIFSSFFLWGGIKQFGSNPLAFNALLWYWIIFIILNIPSLASIIESTFNNQKTDIQDNAIGEIFGVQSKNTFLVKLLPERKVNTNLFDFVEFEYSIDKKNRKGLIESSPF